MASPVKEQIKEYFSGNWLSFYERYLPAKSALKRNGANHKALCPFHDDSNPSLSISMESGRFKCFGCDAKGDAFSFYAKCHNLDARSNFKDVLQGIATDFGIPANGSNGNGKPKPSKPVKNPQNHNHKTKPFHHHELGEPTEKYPYTDEAGQVISYNCRFTLPNGKKDFRQCAADGLTWSVKGLKAVPYRLQKLQNADTVYLVEGEKDVHSLEGLGWVATCNSGGAEKWTENHARYLYGKKEIVIFPDNDEPGRRHAQKVAQSLYSHADLVKIIEIPDLPEKADVSDFIGQFKDKKDAAERLSILIENAPPFKPSQPFNLEDAILLTPDFQRIEVAERKSYLHPWLKQDSINLLSGYRGSGKTMFGLSVVEAITRGEPFGPWDCEQAVPCLYLDGEMTVSDDRERIEMLKLDTLRKAPIYFYSDAYANSLGLRKANLTDESWRDEMKRILLSRSVKLWVVDNIASLSAGLDENAKKDWDPINQWLLELRFAGISTILLHHVNKDGGQRGTSAREDNLDISIMLKKPSDYMPEDGARFIVNFSKARVSTKFLPLISDVEFQLKKDEYDGHVWTFKDVRQRNETEILKMLDDGNYSYKEILGSLGLSSRGYITKVKKKAISKGWMDENSKLTQTGFCQLNG